MGNALTFILKLQDMLTPGMRAAANISNTAAAKIESEFAKIGAGGKKMGASVNELRARLDAINKVRFGTTIEREFNTATRSAQRLESQINRMEGRGRGGGGMIGGLLAGIGIGSIGKEAFSQAANAENQQIAFKVLTGSQKEGDALYSNITKMADSTPFESQDLGRSAKTMLGYGVDKKQIMPTLGMLGDIAAAADHPAESLQSLSLAFGQIAAKGHLAGQETLQMVNAGFNPLKEISDITGISMDKLNKAEEKGAISANMVTEAFKHATGPGGKFHDMMIEQSKTLGGKWSTFMDGVHHKLRDLGKLLKPAAIWVMDFGTALMNNLPALTMVASGIGLIAVATGGWSIAQGVLNFVMNMNPIVRIISLILILGGFIYGLCKQYEGWGQSISAIWEIIKAFGNLAWIPFKMFGETAWYFVQKLWYNIQDFAESVINTFKKVGNAWDLAKGGNFAAAKQALTADIQTNASKQLQNLETSHSKNQAGYANEYANNVMAIGNNMAKIGLHKIAGTPGKVDPTTANTTMDKKAFGGLDAFAGEKGAKSKADGINGGGQRSIVINIGKQIEKLEMHVMTAKEGVDEIGNMVKEELRKVMYSLNGVAAS